MEAEMEDIPVNNQKTKEIQNYMEISKDHEMTPSETGMEDREL